MEDALRCIPKRCWVSSYKDTFLQIIVQGRGGHVTLFAVRQ